MFKENVCMKLEREISITKWDKDEKGIDLTRHLTGDQNTEIE